MTQHRIFPKFLYLGRVSGATLLNHWPCFLTRCHTPADTENNTLVRKYIISTLKALNWHIEEDNFLDNTPYGVKNFTNVIATKDPSAPRRLIVAAHFDSKFFPSSPMNQVGTLIPAAMREVIHALEIYSSLGRRTPQCLVLLCWISRKP